MEKDLERVHVEFNDKARQLFFSLYQAFTGATAQLDRRKDENVFQKLEGKYMNELKGQLEQLARKLMAQYKGIPNSSKLEGTLTHNINIYTNEFRRKIGSH